jgi:beta-N-acetylhexosaminidase
VRRPATLVAVLAVVALMSVAHALPVPAASTSLTCAQTQLASWSLANLANEVVVVPIAPGRLDDITAAARAGFGGVILFGATAPANLATTLAAAQALTPSGHPMMVMTDEEGGGVQRATNLWPSLPWARTMGTWSSTRISAAAKATGAAMLAAGVNTDLAPVLDVDGRAVQPSASNPDGLRSFSGLAAVVTRAGSAFVAGLEAAGVSAVVKHFPGLGGASANTDYRPAHTLPWSTLQASALAPFRAAVSAGVPAVMMSNASVPGLTALPAGISSAAVAALRERLGFTGLVMSDSLSAGAISARGLSVPAAALAALRAGVDQVLFSVPRAPQSALTLALAVRRALVAGVAHHQLARSALIAAAAQVITQRSTFTCTPTTTVAPG